MQLSELQSLEKFLTNVHEDLGEAVDIIEWIAPERKDIHDLVSKAWKELQPQFKTAQIQITKIDSKSFQTAGLSGSQLGLKIKEYEWRRSRFQREFEEQRVSKKTSDHHLRSLLRRVLSAADNILDTLASVFPPVQPIKEFKDTLASVMHP
jgi:hypothetical protein